MRRIALIQLSLIPALACGAPTPLMPDSTGGLITTDSQSYRAVVSPRSVQLTIVATFTNTTADKLTLHPCSQHPPYPPAVGLQRYEDGEWRTVLSPVCTLALILDPPRLSPGATRTDTVHLEGFRAPNSFPRFPAGPVAGVYRLAYSSVYRTWNADDAGATAGGLGEAVPDSLLVSNPFRIEE